MFDVVLRQWFTCTDLGKDLKPIIDRYHASNEYKTGKRSERSPPLPEQEIPVDTETYLGNPIVLDDWLDAQLASIAADSSGPAQQRKRLFEERAGFTAGEAAFVPDVLLCAQAAADADSALEDERESESQVFVMVVRGEAVLEMRGEGAAAHRIQMSNQDLFLVPPKTPFRLSMASQSAAIEMAIRPPENQSR